MLKRLGWSLGAISILALLITAGHATQSFCAVSERTPDGFVNLRNGPGPHYKVVGQVLPPNVMLVGTEQCRDDFGLSLCSEDRQWVFVEEVLGKRPLMKGWMNNKFVSVCPSRS